MATRYVTLKDSNGDTIYPQSVIAQVANGEITGDLIASNTITSDKLKGYLTANTADTWVPVTTGTGEIQHRVIAPLNADGTIPTSAIADGAVTDVKLATPHWKVVSVVNGTNAWNIPAGYRYYRVRMACSAGTPSSGTPAAYVSCDGKTATAWSSGIYNEWSSVSGFQASWDTTTNIVMYASTVAISSAGLTLSSQIELTRNTPSGNYYEGYCITSGSGADWTVQGKIEFAASGSFNLYYERSGCTLSNFHGYVEALVE